MAQKANPWGKPSKGQMSGRMKRRANRRERTKEEPLPENPEFESAVLGSFGRDALRALIDLFRKR